MKWSAQLCVLLALAVVAGVGACTEYPTRPVDRRPAISSVVVFPNVLGQGDSALVTVIASDPDGDALVYDWETDSRLIIKGNRPGDGQLYNTFSNSHVFYRSTSPAVDTAWVYCSVRDQKGGGDGQLVLIPLRD